MITLYLDLLSQPARACIIFCRLNNIQVEEKFVKISGGADFAKSTHDFRKINPTGKIPCLQDEVFVLPESAAILRYLASSKGAPDHWYPKDHKGCARVNSALDWYHGNIMEHYWLGQTLFLASNEISIADLLYSCEIDQLRMLDGADQGPTFAELLQPFPRVEAWLARVADSAEPHWTNATAILRKVVLRGRDAKLKRGQSKL